VTAILELIETRYGSAPLASRDAASPDMTGAFDFRPETSGREDSK
jgi:hypothetical protein